MKRKLLPVVIGLVLILSLTPSSANHDNSGSDLLVDEDGHYNVEIIATNFNFTIIDLNRVGNLLAENMSIEDARHQSTYYNLNNLDHGRTINITAKSRNGTHGLFIDELGVDLTLNKPEPGQEFGEEVNVSSALPSVDTTIHVYCSIYCGEGHSEMNFEIRVGEGSDFGGQQIDVIGDWRVWLLFGIFLLATIVIIALALKSPKNLTEEKKTNE